MGRKGGATEGTKVSAITLHQFLERLQSTELILSTEYLGTHPRRSSIQFGFQGIDQGDARRGENEELPLALLLAVSSTQPKGKGGNTASPA